MSEQILKEVLSLLDEVLSLDGRALAFAADTPLLGDLPELDSMAVATVLTALEDRFHILIDDDEVSGELFESIGSLADFIARKLDA